MDHLGNKDPATRQLLSMVKAHVPKTIGDIVDKCMQSHGAKGEPRQDTPLWAAWSATRTLRMADGPDEVWLCALLEGFRATNARK